MNKTYRLSLKAKLIHGASFIVPWSFLILFFAGAGIIRDPIKWAVQLQYWGVWMVFWLLLLVLLTVFMVAGIKKLVTQSIAVEPAAVILNLHDSALTAQPKGIFYNTIQYSNIIRAVYNTLSRSVRIYSRTHMTRIVPVWIFDERDELLDTLRAHLGERFITQNSADPLWLSRVFYSIVLAVLILSYAVSEPFNLSFVWTPILENPPMIFMHVRAYSLDEDGKSVWIVTEQGLSDKPQIWKATGHNIQFWKGLDTDTYDVMISHDGTGNPVLIKERKIIRWQNGVWVSEPLDPPKVSSFRGHPSVYGSEFWNDYAAMSGKNFVTGESEILYPTPIPDAISDGFRINSDGSLLVEVKTIRDTGAESETY